MVSRSEMSSEDLLDIGTLETLAMLGERRGKDLLGQLVALFSDQGPKSFEKLRAALADGDSAVVSETAHSLKGSYRSLGTLRLAAISEAIEHRGRQGRLDGLEVQLAELEEIFAATKGQLETFLEERRAQAGGVQGGG